MRVVVLTSSIRGTAGYIVPNLIKEKSCEVVMVILNQDLIKNKKKHFLKKIKKIFRIGLIGTINGLIMRKWYGTNTEEILKTKDLDSFCKNNKIPFYTTESINSEKTKELFKTAKADLGISLGNGYIPSTIFEIPKNGMINIHHESLPDYQNAQSVIWQIYNMSSNSGYTIHRISKGIDKGDILYKEDVPINFKNTLKETVSSTYAMLIKQSAVGLNNLLRNFAEFISTAKPQTEGKSYTTPSLTQFVSINNKFKKLKTKVGLNQSSYP